MTEPRTTYRVLGLYAENFKKLSVVDIRPDRSMVEIAGRNGAGKSSVLDALLAALDGTRSAPSVPIRLGEEHSIIKVDLGDIKVTRKFDAKEGGGHTTSLKVEGADGSRFSSPQAVLDALTGALSFDPLEWTRMKPKEQFDAMKRFVPGIDFEDIAFQDRKDFDARTTANRRAKELRAQADGITLPPGKVPGRVDVAALEKRLGDAAEFNTNLETRRGAREAAEARIADIDAEIARLQDSRAAIQKKLDEAEPLAAAIDVTEVRAQLAAARSANATAETAARKAQLETDARAAETEVETYTKRMKDREAAKQAAIAAASMPVEGLSFGDGEVLLHGLPFSQAMKSEQIRASVAIAGAMNPDLRIIMVHDGALIDDVGMKLLADYAEANDLQVWIELVDTTGRVGFVLEDGHLKAEEDEDVV